MLRHCGVLPLALGRLRVVLRHWLPALGHGAPVRRRNDGDNAAVGAIAAGGLDAAVDEEGEVDEPHEAREDGHGGEEAGLAVVGAGAGAGAGLVRLRFVVPAVTAVVDDVGDKGGLDAADDGGAEPDDQRDADVGTRVDACLALAAEPGDDFGEIPDEGEEELAALVFGGQRWSDEGTYDGRA